MTSRWCWCMNGHLPEDDSSDGDREDEDKGLLSGFLAPIGIIAMGAAALTRRD